MSLFRPNLNDFLSEFSRNDKELKDLDESDTKSTECSGNLRNFRKISENFDKDIFFVIRA